MSPTITATIQKARRSIFQVFHSKEAAADKDNNSLYDGDNSPCQMDCHKIPEAPFGPLSIHITLWTQINLIS